MTDTTDIENQAKLRGDEFDHIAAINDAKRSKKGAKRHAGDETRVLVFARDPIDKMRRNKSITPLQFDAGDRLRNTHELALGAGKSSYLNDAGGGGFGPACLAQKTLDAGCDLDAARKAVGAAHWRILEQVVCHGTHVAAYARTYGLTDPKAKRDLCAALDLLAAHYGWV